MRTYSFDQIPGQFHREGDLGVAHRKRLLQPLRLPQVAIGLARRDGTVPGHLLDGIEQMLVPLQQLASVIEALGLLGIAGAARMSRVYNRI